MKKSFNIFLLTAALIGIEACGSKTEKSTSYEAPVIKPLPTLAEKRAKLEAQTTARAEKRLADLEARVKAGKYYTNTSGKIVYIKPDTDPSFTGGEKALRAYLIKNLKYPEQAQKDGLEGTVFVDFVVLSNGNVNDVEVINQAGDDLDQSLINEAVRVVVDMPRWTPGLQNGKPVDVKFSLPVTFQII
jgi:protein TonB